MTATFSFTADAGGVTPITVVDNGVDVNGAANYSGTAYIGGANLELNLDAYTSASPLTLINAPAGLVMDPGDPTPHYHLVGTFGSVNFLGSRRADVHYDYVNGDVFLNNFRIGPGAGAGSLASSTVPEPSGLMLMALGLLTLYVRARFTANEAVGEWLRDSESPAIRPYSITPMVKISRLSGTLVTSFGMLLDISAASSDCRAANVYLIHDGDFNSAANWSDGLAPSLVPDPPSTVPNTYGIDDGLSATFSSGSTTVQALRIGSADKFHTSGDIHFGRLTITGGSLQVIGDGELVVGNENPFWYSGGGDYNKDTVVDAADYTVWRDTLGQSVTPAGTDADGDSNGIIEQADYDYWKARFGNVVGGGEVIMMGSSTLTANAILVGQRTKGLVSIGPNAVVESRPWVTVDEPPLMGPHFSPINTADMRIGVYGPAYDTFGAEPGLNGNGLVDVQGKLNANALFVSSNGGKGELRLSGGTVNLNGALIMSLCEGCVQPNSAANAALLALQSSKVSIVGSKGSFKVGVDPDPVTPDPNLIINAPFSRDINFNYNGGRIGYPMTATFSFTADAGGVTPITVVDNGLDSLGNANLSGTAYIGGANLELNLDAYTSASPLTLIDAPAGLVGTPAHSHLVGQFGTVTFLGTRMADIHYDYANGDVFLNNFRIGPGAERPGEFCGARAFRTNVNDTGTGPAALLHQESNRAAQNTTMGRSVAKSQIVAKTPPAQKLVN